MLELHLIFRGNVQGVGFRATAKQKADKLHLTGYVKNLSDKSVEMILQGKEENLQVFLLYLKSQFHIEEILEERKKFSHIRTQFNIL